MKILYNINSGNPGGLEQYTLDLVKGMIQKGHQVYVWCLPGEIIDWYKGAGAVVTTRDIKGEIDFDYIRELKKYVISNHINLVHTSELKAGINAIFAVKDLKHVGLVTHIHTPISEWLVQNTFKKIYTYIETIVYSMLVNLFSDCEIALTESRKKVKTRELILPSKITVIPNGFDLLRLDMTIEEKREYRAELRSKFCIEDDDVVLGLVSRITQEKGHEILVKAFLEITRMSDKKVKLLIAGGGKLENHIRSLVSGLGLQDKTVITGVFDGDIWKKMYTVFDIYTFPSLAEGFGLVLVEGMYTGVPVICSDLPVLKEVGGDTVTYFKSGDHQDLAKKIIEKLNSYETKNLWMGTMAKMRVINEFSYQKFINNYGNLYVKIMKKKNLLAPDV